MKSLVSERYDINRNVDRYRSLWRELAEQFESGASSGLDDFGLQPVWETVHLKRSNQRINDAAIMNQNADQSTLSTHDLRSPTTTLRWRRVLPGVVSVALIAWLVRRISFAELARAANQIEWHFVVPVTAALVVCLYLWDAVCVRWLFSDSEHEASYHVALQARGTSYLAGAFNYGLGQGVLAWMMADAQGLTLVAALSRLVLLAYHDMGVLFGLGLLSSVTSDDPPLRQATVICTIGLAVTAALAILIRFMPASWRIQMQATRWGAWLGIWSWKRSVQLTLLRVVNFVISMIYAAATLSLCGVGWNLKALCTAVPLIQLAEGLPIGMSGLGTRETTLVHVLGEGQSEVVLAVGLIWSSGLIVGRTTIGLGHLWLSRKAATRSGQAPNAPLQKPSA